MADQGEQHENNPDDEHNRFRRIGRWMHEHFPDSNTMVAVATIALVIVGAWGIVEGRKALKLAQRAWITPIAATFPRAPETGKSFHFTVAFINSGREPAINVNVKFTSATIDAFDSDTVDMRDIRIPAADACPNTSPTPGQIFPPSAISGIGVGYSSIPLGQFPNSILTTNSCRVIDSPSFEDASLTLPTKKRTRLPSVTSWSLRLPRFNRPKPKLDLAQEIQSTALVANGNSKPALKGSRLTKKNPMVTLNNLIAHPPSE